MTESDREPIVTIALLAALADGQATTQEKTQLQQALARLGVINIEAIADRVAAGQIQLADVVRGLSGNDSRQLAYETAVVVCNTDGPANEKESRFLADLRAALGLDASSVAAVEQGAAALAGAPVTAPAQVGSGAQPPVAGLDDFILQQAVIAGALELLPRAWPISRFSRFSFGWCTTSGSGTGSSSMSIRSRIWQGHWVSALRPRWLRALCGSSSAASPRDCSGA